MSDDANKNPNPPSPGPTGSAFVLIKTKGAESCSLTFWSEAELREHLEAMWSVTDWHLAAVVQVPQNAPR